MTARGAAGGYFFAPQAPHFFFAAQALQLAAGVANEHGDAAPARPRQAPPLAHPPSAAAVTTADASVRVRVLESRFMAMTSWWRE